MDIKQVNTDINIKNPILDSKSKDSSESEKIEIERKEDECAKFCCCCCCCYYICIQILTLT
jgi:hypothetical protein